MKEEQVITGKKYYWTEVLVQLLGTASIAITGFWYWPLAIICLTLFGLVNYIRSTGLGYALHEPANIMGNLKTMDCDWPLLILFKLCFVLYILVRAITILVIWNLLIASSGFPQITYMTSLGLTLISHIAQQHLGNYYWTNSNLQDKFWFNAKREREGHNAEGMARYSHNILKKIYKESILILATTIATYLVMHQ